MRYFKMSIVKHTMDVSWWCVGSSLNELVSGGFCFLNKSKLEQIKPDLLHCIARYTPADC